MCDYKKKASVVITIGGSVYCRHLFVFAGRVLNGIVNLKRVNCVCVAYFKIEPVLRAQGRQSGSVHDRKHGCLEEHQTVRSSAPLCPLGDPRRPCGSQ